MKKFSPLASVLLASLLFLTGCSAHKGTTSSDSEIGLYPDIPFSEDQYYAVAYLGYQEMEYLDDYAVRYLDSDQIPIHYISAGDFYLVIPRYSGMALSLYRNDLDTSQPVLVFQDPDCSPFILQCNVSDIFEDATVCLTYQEMSMEFSPFISLKDGSVVVGSQGLLLSLNP